jgi:hypothetical protein
MNKAAYIVYIGAFLMLPPALLMARWFDKARMPWVLLIAVSAIAGWLLVNLAYMFCINDLLARISARGTQGETIAFRRDDFLFQFGWLFGPVYLMPWLFLYGIFIFARRILANRGA